MRTLRQLRRILPRIAVALTLAVAAFLPVAPGVAQAVNPGRYRATSPAYTTKCSPAVYVSGRKLASCGQTLGNSGRAGTYDSALDKITWGPWQARQTAGLALPNLYYYDFIGYPWLSVGPGAAVIHGTEYRQIPGSNGGPPTVEGRRGVYRSVDSRFWFEPSEGWHRAVGCVPVIPCHEWKHEPGAGR